MLAYIGIAFGIMAMLLTLVLVGITCVGWFGLTGKVK